jgi:hypothetical protein
MQKKNIVITCIFLLFLITFLLITKYISSSIYAILFSVILIIGIALYSFDRLKELDIKNLRIILSEAKEIRKDIYAKAEIVRKLGEEMADLTAFNVTRVGRFAPPNLQEKMLEARDKIKNILKEIGSSETKIKEISSQIEDMVLYDLKSKVYHRVQEITHQLLMKGKNIDREHIHSKVKEILFNNYDRDMLRKFLKEKEAYSEELEGLLDKVDRFIKYKKI